MQLSVTVRQRLQAAFYHMLCSMILLGIALYWVFVLWYPTPLATATGVTHMYWMMLAIDLILGPLLTFFVMKNDRNKLIFDLVVIGVIQLSAYGYGLNIVAQGRPVALVFVIDDFELIRPVDLVSQAGIISHYHPSIFSGPQWVGADYSTNEKIRNEQRNDEMFKGISLAQHPETYVDLGKKSQQIARKAHALKELSFFNKKSFVTAA
ncbi:MAG: hypothetical protein RLY58_329, partial [Pseudomonadota bacterium]